MRSVHEGFITGRPAKSTFPLVECQRGYTRDLRKSKCFFPARDCLQRLGQVSRKPESTAVACCCLVAAKVAVRASFREVDWDILNGLSARKTAKFYNGT